MEYLKKRQEEKNSIGSIWNQHLKQYLHSILSRRLFQVYTNTTERESISELLKEVKKPVEKYYHNNCSKDLELYIPIKFIISHPYYFWDWRQICQDYNITEQMILENPNVPWDHNIISNYMKKEFMLEHMEKPWNLMILFDADIEKIMETIRKYPNIHCDCGYLSRLNFPIEFIMEFPYVQWDYYEICKFNYTITESMIEMFPFFPWNFEALTSNLNISNYFILNTKYKWCKERILFRYGITLKDVFAHLDFGWNIGYLEIFWPYFDWNTIINNFHNYYYPVPQILSGIMETIEINHQMGIPLNYDLILKMDDLKISDIKNNPIFDNFLNSIVTNESIEIQDIYSNYKMQLDYYDFPSRKNIKFDDIEFLFSKKIFDIDYEALSNNDFTIEKEKFLRHKQVLIFLDVSQQIREIKSKKSNKLNESNKSIMTIVNTMELIRYTSEFI